MLWQELKSMDLQQFPAVSFENRFVELHCVLALLFQGLRSSPSDWSFDSTRRSSLTSERAGAPGNTLRPEKEAHPGYF